MDQSHLGSVATDLFLDPRLDPVFDERDDFLNNHLHGLFHAKGDLVVDDVVDILQVVVDIVLRLEWLQVERAHVLQALAFRLAIRIL